ncbi:MAG: KUP/HAK/KT family potassium transporter [Bacteroidales bacterium]|nr:KUP/HAK/KT family potassium transporter [Bacteroidales bacterium]
MEAINGSKQHHRIKKFTLAGLLTTLGIVFGDIGTSPLYTLKAVINWGSSNYNDLLIYGCLSAVFWTLTLQATIKYIIIALRADNNGEGGIFALYALLGKKPMSIVILTMIGGSALLADGVLTPSITVTAAVEGMNLIRPGFPVILIVLVIFILLFFIQNIGTSHMAKWFGPAMVVWFLMIGISGTSQLIKYPDILKAINPVYAYEFLTKYPGAFIILGAIFLCTTGAEIIYSSLGNCGRKNIQISWVFVKLTLLLSYFGQGAWLMINNKPGNDINPFFAILPEWFLFPGIIISIFAAIVASQAIINSSCNLLSEAISLNFWPKMKILYPTMERNYVYLPNVNWFLWIACSFTVIFFRNSTNMASAYGLAISIAMLITTFILAYFMNQKDVNHRLVFIFLAVYLTVEVSFLISNLYKLSTGAWFTLLLTACFLLIMYGWYFGRKIKNRYITFANLNDYIDLFKDLSKDETVPKTATNLVYIIRANNPEQVESKVIFSIFRKQPKRANTYWMLHVNIVNDPKKFEYKVTHIIPKILIRVDFNIGFKVEPRIDLYFKEVVEDLVKSGEITLDSSYESLKKHDFKGDFKFVLIDRVMPTDNPLSTLENITLTIHNFVRKLSLPDVKAFHLDSTNTIEEQVPIIIDQPGDSRIKRVS